jgi:hypothetical protein
MEGLVGAVLGLGCSGVPLALTAFCVIDVFRKDRGREWIWILVLLPFIGSLIYLANFYASESRGARQIDVSWKRWSRLRQLKQLAAVQDTAGLWLEMGELHFQRREWMEALKALQRTLDLDDSLLKAHFLAGSALIEIGRHDAALAHLDYVLEHEATYGFGEAQLRRGRALETLGRIEEARDAYGQVVARHTYGEAVYRHAVLQAKTGNTAAAITALERMVREAAMAPRRDRPWIRLAKTELARLKQG